MRHRDIRVFGHAARVLIAVIAALLLSPPSQAEEAGVPCVPLPATRAKPPSLPPGPPPGARETDALAAVRPKPICPEGQVPDVKALQQGAPTRFKGNPLLRPGAGSEPSPENRAGKRSRFLTFEEVYGGGQTPFRSTNAQSCDGINYNPGEGCYYYASAALQQTIYGAGMTLSVNRPAYVRVRGTGHTLAEISIQGGEDDGDIVEIGWNVAPEQYGDADPHLFVFHWFGMVGTCYDACGFEQVSNVYYPGMNLSALVGRDVKIAYVLSNGDWWAWFDNQWLGYFPGSLWPEPFAKASLTQWFGEVVADNGVPPKTQMGAGSFPAIDSAAHMTELCTVVASDGPCLPSDQHFVAVSPPAASRYYGIKRTGASALRYGGPGR